MEGMSLSARKIFWKCCNMTIKELTVLSEAQVRDVVGLMYELDSEIEETSALLSRTLESDASHFFAITEEDGHIIGCATLCVYDSPTGPKASLEDVVVGSRYRGSKPIGRVGRGVLVGVCW